MADKKEKPDEEQEEASGGKKKLIIIIVAVLLLVGISVGVTMMLLGGDEEAQTEIVEEVEPVKGDPTYVEFKAFTVNLGPDDPVGFLQVEINVLTYFEEVAKELEMHKPLIRNNLALLFGSQNSADLRSSEGKQVLQGKTKESIQQIINKYGGGGEVDNVFFINFVMQ